MKSSTKDKIKGAAERVKGGAKENAGRATKSRDMEASGTADKAGGKIRSKVGDVKKVFGK
ncbi:MAG: CsbD family protein [Chthoniobacterales bacterium]|nr:CsbD family protein [Chthoniobacterales bacterium]